MTKTNTKTKCIEQLKRSLAASSWSEDAQLIEPFLHEWRDRWQGNTPLLLLPRSTDEVVTAVNICAEYGISITTQGGNTGLVGGQIPQGEILLSTKYLNSVRVKDEFSITVESGCILQTVQELSNKGGVLFPLSIASQGSATIGGLCSTNAGGMHVVRYGSMRDLVLGIEVVLADGSVLNTLSPLKKDNTGYKMTSLFLGAEGTLGIITAVQLKLFPKPVNSETLLVGLESIDNAINFYRLCQSNYNDHLSLIELISHQALEFVTTHIPNCRSVFTETYSWYILLQFDFLEPTSHKNNIEELISDALSKGIILDAIKAESLSQAQDLLNLREHISEAQKYEGGSIKHDISVPIDSISEFIIKASKVVQVLVPQCRPVPFGHIGDGNIHFNVSQPLGMDKDEYLSHWESMNRLVHDIVVELGGSISAEHGIGILKKKELAERGNPVKLMAMKNIKKALDPNNIFNPRVLFDET